MALKIYCIAFLVVIFSGISRFSEIVAVTSRDTFISLGKDSAIQKRELEKYDSISYSADKIMYDISKKVIFLTGNSFVRYQNIQLSADTIYLMFKTNMLIATGNPVLLEGKDTLVGESISYNLKTRSGRVRRATAYSDDSKYIGSRISRSSDENFNIENGSYTSCSKTDSLHYCFYGNKIKIIPDDKAISRPVVLNIGDVPVLALPYFIIPLKKGRHSGWLNPKWGGSPVSNGYIDNIGYYWATNDYTDYTLSGKISNFQDFLIRGEARYALRYKFSGNIAGRYSLSTAENKINNLWALDYNHNQTLLPDGSLRLSGKGSLISQKNFYNYTSDDSTELLNQQLTANMYLSKNFKKINAYANLSWYRNQNLSTNIVTQNLPNLTFNLNSRPLIPVKNPNDTLKWYNKIQYSYSFNGKQQFTTKKNDSGNDTIKHFAGFAQSIPISSSFNILKYIKFFPRINIQHSLFDTYIGKKGRDTTYAVSVLDTLPADTVVFFKAIDSIYSGDSITKIIYLTNVDSIKSTVYDTTYLREKQYSVKNAQTFNWNVGADISTNLYGLFPIKIFALNGIRHIFTPSVGYTYQPKSPTAKNNMMFPTIGISETQSEDISHNISLRAGNLFQARIKTSKGADKKITLFSLSVASSYSVKKDSSDNITKKWNDISLNASTSIKWVNLSYRSTFHPYTTYGKLDLTPELLNYSVDIRPKTFSLSGHFWSGDRVVLNKIEPDGYLDGIPTTKPAWSLSLSPSYSFSKSRTSIDENFTTKRYYNMNTSANLKISSRWSLSWGSSYNFNDNKFNNHSLTFYCDLECWDLKFNWNPTGYNAGYFYFIVKIKKYPEIKWDRRPEDG